MRHVLPPSDLEGGRGAGMDHCCIVGSLHAQEQSSEGGKGGWEIRYARVSVGSGIRVDVMDVKMWFSLI